MNKDEFESIRKQIGWTKRELAIRLGITERTIYGYMAGNPIPGPVEKLMNYFLKTKGEL